MGFKKLPALESLEERIKFLMDKLYPSDGRNKFCSPKVISDTSSDPGVKMIAAQLIAAQQTLEAKKAVLYANQYQFAAFFIQFAIGEAVQMKSKASEAALYWLMGIKIPDFGDENELAASMAYELWKKYPFRIIKEINFVSKNDGVESAFVNLVFTFV